MSKAALSIAVFAAYLLVNGTGFIVAPNQLLPAFGLPLSHEPWIRCLGIVLTMNAFYHAVAARKELVPFFRATIAGRTFVLVCLATLAALGSVPLQLLFFGLVDLAFAIWTFVALRLDATAGRTSPRFL